MEEIGFSKDPEIEGSSLPLCIIAILTWECPQYALYLEGRQTW